MTATTIFIAGVGVYALGRLSAGKHPFNVQTVVGGAFVAFALALADQGEAQSVARGFAWLFFTVALLAALDEGLLKSTTTKAAA